MVLPGFTRARILSGDGEVEFQLLAIAFVTEGLIVVDVLVQAFCGNERSLDLLNF